MELWFKIAFLVLFGVLIAAAVRVAGRLRRRPETGIDQTQHELPILRAIRPALGIVFYVAIFDWLLPGRRLDFAVLELAPAIRLAGVALAFLAVGLIVWSFGALGVHYRGGVGLWDDHELVTSGPYRRVRHPIYLGFFLTMVGVALLSADWLVGISGILLTLSIPLLRVPVEEAELEERFGDRWRSYRERTGTFLPGL